MFRHLPNILTISRIALIPVILAFTYFDSAIMHFINGWIFGLISLTDFFDGYLARKYQISSRLGQLLDPIADKLLVSSILVVFIDQGKVDLLPALAIILRELTVSGLREFLADLRISVPVSRLAKVKTFLQMVALLFLVSGNQSLGLNFIEPVGRFALWIAAVLTLITGYAYLKASKSYFISDNEYKR